MKKNIRNNLKFLSIILVLFFIIALHTNVHSQMGTSNVQATGVATVFAGDQALARDQAIDDALRNAVEQGLGTFVQSSTLVENYQLVSDNILTWSNGYVKTYTIVSERLTDPTSYEVVIDAQLELSNLQNDWNSIQNLLSKMQNPRILFIIDEQNIGQSYNKYHFLSVDMTAAEGALMNKFLNKGFDVIDAATMRENVRREQAYAALTGNSRVAAQIGKNLGAEIIVTGKAVAKVATGINLGGMKSCQANLTARVVKADVASVIATSSQHAAYPHIDEVTGGTKAIEKAANKLADDLMNKIAKKWQDEFYNATTVKVLVKDVESFTEINNFKSSLKFYVRGIKDVYQRNFSAGLAELDVKITGNADQLARELERKEFDKFDIKILEYSLNRIVLKLIPREMTN